MEEQKEIKEERVELKEEKDPMAISIGTKEAVALEPAKVKIENIEIEPVGAKGNEKVVCICKHPNKEETIRISSVKVEKGGVLKETGLWFNKDSEGKIQKGSSLAMFMQHIGATTLLEIKEKETNTILDSKGFLTFKAY